MKLRHLLLTLLSVAAPAAADPRPMSAGAQPGPRATTEVRIAREDLTIDVDRKAASVKAHLVLENGGPAAALSVGFPCDDSLEPGIAGLECKTRIEVRVDGKKQPARREKDHWVWPMRFAPAQKTEVDIAYRSPLRNDRYQTPYHGMGALHYRLVTGAEWAGPIGELAMRVTLPTDAVIHITPAGSTRERGRISWALRDVEPAGDLAIFFAPAMLGRRDGSPEERRALARDLRKELPDLQRWASLLQGLMGKSAIVLPPLTDEQVAATVEESAKLYESP